MQEANTRAPAVSVPTHFDQDRRAAYSWESGARDLFALAAIGSVSSPPVANIAVGLALIAFFIAPAPWERLRAAARQPWGRGILLLLGVLAVAMLWTQDAPWAKRFGVLWSWRPWLIALIGTSLFSTPESKDRFSWTLVTALAASALASFVIWFAGGPLLLDEVGIVLRNHTTQGMAYVVGANLAVMLLLRRPPTGLKRWFLVAAALLFVLNIATVTSGRSAHVALLASVAVALFLRVSGWRRWLVLLLVPVVGAGMLAASSMVRHRFAEAAHEFGTATQAQQETSMGVRVYIWQTTTEMIREHPWLGYGVGGFVPAFSVRVQQHRDDTPNWVAASRASDTHNEYLHVWVEAGLAGLIAFLVFAASAWWQPVLEPHRAVGMALLSAWLVTSLTNSHFQTFAEGHLIGLVLGCLLAYDPPRRL